MNTGTPESEYGYWYPGKANDGGAGGGFEPAAYGTTWLGQPHHRGSWYYASEIDLGYCGALRTAATVLSDDPIFGLFCYGGTMRRTAHGIAVVPQDGLRRRFHALLGGRRRHLISETDRFPSAEAILIAKDLSEVRFTLESANPARHTADVRLSGLPPGSYTVRSGGKHVARLDLSMGQEYVLRLPMEAGQRQTPFLIVRGDLTSRKKVTP